MLSFGQKQRISRWKKSFWKKEFPKVDMISLYEKHTGLTLKRSGKAWIGKCPFHSHEDRKPSFAIYPDTDSYYCFGCEETGTSNWLKTKLEKQGL